jgi:hypothetical protein
MKSVPSPPRLHQNKQSCCDIGHLYIIYHLCSVQTHYDLGPRTRSFAVGLARLSHYERLLLPHFMAEMHIYICHLHVSWHEMQIVYIQPYCYHNMFKILQRRKTCCWQNVWLWSNSLAVAVRHKHLKYYILWWRRRFGDWIPLRLQLEPTKLR